MSSSIFPTVTAIMLIEVSRIQAIANETYAFLRQVEWVRSRGGYVNSKWSFVTRILGTPLLFLGLCH